MTLQEYIDDRNITKYHLSQISGIPKTTIIDICSGRSSLHKCSAHTIQQIAKALDCTMEFIMSLDTANLENSSDLTGSANSRYDEESGLPKSKKYLECDLPPYLQSSLKNMIASWEILDSGGTDLHWDMNWCELNADINCAEVDQEISSEQAWYLRETYLRMERGD